MCLTSKELVSSHLMPAFLYDYCRKGEHRPLRFGDGAIFPTDRQTQDYLLCEACEDVLNQGGEKWIADKLATMERTFPLYDTLTKVPPIFDEDGMLIYLGEQNSDMEVKKLIHFATGIFWKASVHSWSASETKPRIELGPYSERIRKWLRNEAVFPKRTHLVIAIEKPLQAQITVNEPYEGVPQAWRTHFMHVPGILFMLSLGGSVHESVSHLAITTQGNPINVSEGLTASFEQLMKDKLKNSRKTHAYLKAKGKADEERKRAAK
jgi:hypothetical protein